MTIVATTVRQIAIAQDTFAFIDVGDGAPVLFLHGALTDHRMWQPHCTNLSSAFRCLAYTQRYHGANVWRDDSSAYGVRTHAVDLNRLIEALELDPVTVVAWSYAGHVALHAAELRPDHFSRIIMFEPGIRTLALNSLDGAEVARDAEAMFGPIFEAVARGDLRGAARALIDGSGGKGCFDAVSAERRAVYFENAHTLPLLLAQEDPPPATCEALQRLAIPVHVLWGERSRPVSKVSAKAVAECFPDGLHNEIPGVGHLWPEESPQAFCRVLAELGIS